MRKPRVQNVILFWGMLLVFAQTSSGQERVSDNSRSSGVSFRSIQLDFSTVIATTSFSISTDFDLMKIASNEFATLGMRAGFERNAILKSGFISTRESPATTYTDYNLLGRISFGSNENSRRDAFLGIALKRTSDPRGAMIKIGIENRTAPILRVLNFFGKIHISIGASSPLYIIGVGFVLGYDRGPNDSN